MKNKKPRILIFDLEVMPNLVRTWRKWEQNVIWYERYGYTWSISYKWLGEKKIYHKNLTDFNIYKKDKYNDKQLVEFIWKLIDEADVCIAHNGNAFDLKNITGRFVYHKLPPPSPYQKIDTKLLYKRYLNEDSNSLKDICKKHGLPNKLETGGEKLWEDCEKGDKKAIKKMAEYNNGDIISLEAAYLHILPYIINHPNMGVLKGELIACPNCGSKKVQKRGYNKTRSGITNQRIQCQDCAAWSQQPIKGGQIR